MKPNQATKHEGFSLIEVILSMFMVVVLFLLYVSALNLVALLKKVKMEDIAYHIANKQLETLRETPFASLPASGTITDTDLSTIPQGSGSYTVAAYAPLNKMKEITVTVNWNDGSSKNITIKSLAGTGGINP